MKINGTIINYYFHCKRQCFFAYNRLNMEDNSDDVLIGRVLHETKFSDDEKGEIAIENIKVDKITDDYVIEYKKSDSDLEAVRWQLIYYLYILKQKGIIKKGKIIFEEAKDKKVIYLELTNEIEKELLQVISEIKEFLSSSVIPEFIVKTYCRRCAYYSYCKI